MSVRVSESRRDDEPPGVVCDWDVRDAMRKQQPVNTNERQTAAHAEISRLDQISDVHRSHH